MIQQVLPTMRERKQGLIMNISSTGAIRPAPCWDLYNASKFAAEGLLESLAGSLAHFNIHVSLIEPGLLATEFLEITPVGKRLKTNPYHPLMEGLMQAVKPMLATAPNPRRNCRSCAKSDRNG